MASDSLKDRRERSLLDEHGRTLAIVLAVVVVVGVVGAVAFMMMGDDDEGDAATIDNVPDGVDGVIQIDGDVTDDDLVLETLDDGLATAWWAIDTGIAPSIEEVLGLIGEDEVDYERTTAFFSADLEGEEYAGAIVEIDGDGMAIVDIVEDEVGELDQTEYEGVDVYQIDAEDAAEEADTAEEYDLTGLITEFVGEDTTAWVAPVGNGTVILGSESAARDAIDVHNGDADPQGGDLAAAHDRAEDGPVKLTVDVPAIENAIDHEDIKIANLANVVDNEIAAGLELVGGSGHNVDLLSGTYNPADREQRTATFDVQAMMDDEEGAESLMGLFEDRIEDTDSVLDDPEDILSTTPSQRAAGHQEGQYVNLEIPEMPETVVGHVAGLVDEFGGELLERTALDLVPADVEAENVHTYSYADLDHDIEELDDRELERIASFTAGDEVATVVELDEDGDELVDLVVDHSGADVTVHEDREGYRLVDITAFDTDEEPEITEVLSGEVAADTEWMATVSGSLVVFGTQDAVEDSIDVYRGIAAPNDDLSW